MESLIMQFVIRTSWDGTVLQSQDTVNISFLDTLSRDGEVILTVDAPFYDDPQPQAPPGPLFHLWDYEVVEVFILGDDDRYLEIEVGPHGQHLVLLLDGYRNIKVHSLDMKYDWKVENGRWKGKAFIPLSYFPKGASKLNCYAIHGQNESRVYSSLFPTEQGKYEEPDFHRLEYFKNVDFNLAIKDGTKELSPLWKKTLGIS